MAKKPLHACAITPRARRDGSIIELTFSDSAGREMAITVNHGALVEMTNVLTALTYSASLTAGSPQPHDQSGETFVDPPEQIVPRWIQPSLTPTGGLILRAGNAMGKTWDLHMPPKARALLTELLQQPTRVSMPQTEVASSDEESRKSG